MRLTRQQVKYSVALLVSGCLLSVVFNSCNYDCKAATDKLTALIGQLQGECCVYQTTSDEKISVRKGQNLLFPDSNIGALATPPFALAA